MAKFRMNSQRYTLKVNSLTLKNNNWNYNVSLEDARKREEVISLGDSQTLRFIRDIKKYEFTEDDIKNTKKEIKRLKKTSNTEGNRKKIKKLYDKLDEMLFVPEYIGVVFNTKSDFDHVCKNGFTINGKKYKRLVGTTGGVKNSTVQFCSDDIYDELVKRMENGWNSATPIVPAKFEAYKSLSCSASTPLTIKPRILIVRDPSVMISDRVIRVFDDGDPNGGYEVEYDVPYEAEKQFCDGCGMMTPEFAAKIAIDLDLCYYDESGNKVANYIPSGVNTRYAYEKGMLCTFDFKLFAEEVAGTYMLEDAWGAVRDIRDYDVVLTDNMMKLCAAYDSLEHYLKECNKHGYDFSITKITGDALEPKRELNYQYLQSYDLSDEDIEELIKETVDNINGALGDDIRKAILYTRGIHATERDIVNSDPDFMKAIMIDDNVINDPFVKQQIYKMIYKKIDMAKLGRLQVDGNYAIVCGDLYALCEGIFKMEIKGLLGFGEFYSGHWVKQGVMEVVAFRSPMTSHNNIRKFKYIVNDDINKWFKYLDQLQVINSWDTTCDALNGMDMDSDAVVTTNNPILLKKYRFEQTIVCEQSSAPKIKVTENLLRKSNKLGFGSDIGVITNRCTAMYDILAGLEEGAPEYKELQKRILISQNYQQNAIDSIKGISFKKTPKHWYDYKTNRVNIDMETDEILDDDETIREKEFNLKIMANKKPYFFIYNYPNLMSEYKSLTTKSNEVSIVEYGMKYEDLLIKENKTEDENRFIKYVENKIPIFNNDCTMNRICHKIENLFSNIRSKIKNSKFDYNLYKSKKGYTKEVKSSIEKRIKNYKKMVKESICSSDVESRKEVLNIIRNQLKIELLGICSNEEMLTNVILDITYGKNVNKELAWNLCGEQIIKNLLHKNGNVIKHIKLDYDGDIEWNGYKFKEVEVIVEED
nr:MAG TPA: RNA dependent RNA polymerase [Caudoviricetes sp.]